MGRHRKPEIHDYIATSLKLPPDLHAAIRMQALAEHRSMNDVVLTALTRHVQLAGVNDFITKWESGGRKGHLWEVK